MPGQYAAVSRRQPAEDGAARVDDGTTGPPPPVESSRGAAGGNLLRDGGDGELGAVGAPYGDDSIRASWPLQFAIGCSLGLTQEETAKLSHPLLYVVFAALLSFANFGYSTGVLSGASPMVIESWDLTPWANDVVVTCGVGVAAIGSAAGGPLGDKFGRLWAIGLSAVIATVASLLSAFAPSYWYLVTARCGLGFAVGVSFTVVPLYVAECVPVSMRGRVVDLSDFAIVGGQLLSGLLNGCVESLLHEHVRDPWRLSLGFGCVFPAALCYCATMKCYESPRWLARGESAAQKRDARRALSALFGRVVAADHVQLQVEAVCVDGSIWRTKRVLRALALGVGMLALNQFSGINTAMYYGASILVECGFNEDLAIWLASALTAAQLVGVTVSLQTIDTKGRRFTALRSISLTVPCLVVLGLSFTFHWPWAAVAGLVGYLVAFGSGLSGVAYVVNSEIYPIEIRARCSAIGAFTFWASNFAVSLSFPLVAAEVGAQYAFWFFCAVSIFGCVVLFFFLPETAHKPLDEIAEFFQADPYPMRRWHQGTLAYAGDTVRQMCDRNKAPKRTPNTGRRRHAASRVDLNDDHDAVSNPLQGQHQQHQQQQRASSSSSREEPAHPSGF